MNVAHGKGGRMKPRQGKSFSVGILGRALGFCNDKNKATFPSFHSSFLLHKAVVRLLDFEE